MQRSGFHKYRLGAVKRTSGRLAQSVLSGQAVITAKMDIMSTGMGRLLLLVAVNPDGQMVLIALLELAATGAKMVTHGGLVRQGSIVDTSHAGAKALTVVLVPPVTHAVAHMRRIGIGLGLPSVARLDSWKVNTVGL